MNESTDDLDALGRIMVAIKTYRHQPLPAGQDLTDAYLKQHLSRQDWQLWQRLHEKGARPLIVPN